MIDTLNENDFGLEEELQKPTHKHIRFVTEIDLKNGCKHLRYFVFPLDADKVFCETSREYINEFFHSTKDRNYYPSKSNPEFLYHIQTAQEKEINTEVSKKTFGYDLYKDVPVINLNSVQELFDLIGYNPKKNKWCKSTGIKLK